jgi:hypothetical protein
MDVLEVINHINNPPPGAVEGEFVGLGSSAVLVEQFESLDTVPSSTGAAPEQPWRSDRDVASGVLLDEADGPTPVPTAAKDSAPGPLGVATNDPSALGQRMGLEGFEARLAELEDVLEELAADVGRVWRGMEGLDPRPLLMLRNRSNR